MGKTENAHLAGPQSELLQLNRKSAATQKIRSMIVAMKQDVDDEEMMQKSILDEEELKYNVTKAHRIANVTAWKAQVKVFEAAEKAWRKAYGEYHGAEMALSQETATRSPPLPSRTSSPPSRRHSPTRRP